MPLRGSEIDQLASLTGLLVVASLRLLYVHFHKRQQQTSLPAKHPSSQDEESQPLIAASHPTPISLSWRGKIACNLAAIAYIAVTIIVTVATLKEYEGPVLRDSRFVLGRGGMVTVALIVLARTWLYQSNALLRGLQADAVTLVAIPYVMEILGTPVAQFPERRLVDFLVAPALGTVCFLAAKGVK